MKIYEGTIITCDPKNRVTKYLVEDKGKIIFTGDELPGIYDRSTMINLENKALLPSFADTHLHYSSFALFAGTLDIREAKAIPDIKELITAYNARCKPPFILAFGASAHSVIEKRLLTRSDRRASRRTNHDNQV